MRSFIPQYELVTPHNFMEALELLSKEPGVWQPFAGGTDLMVLLEAGKLSHTKYINIWSLAELRTIEVESDSVSIGALTTYTDIQSHPILQTEFPMLCQAASETGGLAIQNRGTLGGNIVNASPAADSPPALLAYGAEVELTSIRGARRLPYDQFHNGYKLMDLKADELLTKIHLPRQSYSTHYYRKVGTRKAQAISKVCFSAVANLHDGLVNEVRIALGSVAPIPLRCKNTEAAIRAEKISSNNVTKARDVLAQEISPISDIRSTKDYRLRVSQNLLAEFLSSLKHS